MCPIARPTQPEPPWAVRLTQLAGLAAQLGPAGSGLDRLQFYGGGRPVDHDKRSGWVRQAEETRVWLSGCQPVGLLDTQDTLEAPLNRLNELSEFPCCFHI